MTKAEAVDQFIERVQYIHDDNYGDFKRKVDLAMTRMWELLGHDSRPIDNLIYGAKKRLVYGPHMEVEEARFMVLDMAEAVKKEV